MLPFDAVTSRTFWALQSSCRHSCDMHRVLQEASEAFRAQRMLFRRKTPGGAMGVAHAHWYAHEEVQERQGEGWRGMVITSLTAHCKMAIVSHSYTPPTYGYLLHLPISPLKIYLVFREKANVIKVMATGSKSFSSFQQFAATKLKIGFDHL